MSSTAANEWLEANQRYLSAALAWLRQRLEQHAQHGQTATPLAPSPESAQSQKQDFWRRQPASPSHPALAPAALSAPATSSIQAIPKPAAMTDAEKQRDKLPALVMLGELFGLTDFERNLLLFCVAMERDTRVAALCAHIQGDQNKAYPTFALALTLFDEPHWDVMSPERPLRYWRLLEIHQAGAQPLVTSPLRADERIVNYIQGVNYLDDRLASLVTLLKMEQGDLPASQQRAVGAILHNWHQAATLAPFSPLPVIQLMGSDISSKCLVASHVANNLKLRLYRMPAEVLAQHANNLETLARLWHRETILFPVALYLDAQEIDGAAPGEGQVLALNRFLTRSEGYFLLGVREAWPRLDRSNMVQDVAKPTIAEQETAWTEALDGYAPGSPAALASQFNLNVSAIHHIARLELDNAAGDTTSLPNRLWDACRSNVYSSLDALAQRLNPKATWDDLVLPDEATKTLKQIQGQVMQRNTVYEVWGFARKMNRGLGINALFSGESGTGKTMAAEVIANALRLDLYRIDLSAVVSKYIGETEKNLRRLFDAAEDGGAILFFDEADALFGKRSEVKDSHDRYANIEINYLLQRMEAYSGLAILATNMKSSLDTAFTRRLRFSITFPFPGPVERKRMWEKVFPENTPKEGVDYERLARFTLTGGSIHNIALNAAFLAARSSKRVVSMPHILDATRAEFRKMERPVNEAEFLWKPQVTVQVVTGGNT